ncbi:MAG: beta-ketoacyl-[acyl-carrier-protein] synthase II, partial [Chloroflexi bacterium]|nr:beta-ketoacyl-[acyl-carrier-protein] synthase II [Chloroflexota bacterium]
MRKPDYDRRVVVTGLGVISSVGNDPTTAWANLVNGVSGIGPITRFDTTPYEAKLGGEVRDFDAAAWMDPKAARRSEASLHFGVAAASQALTDSGFEITDQNRTEVGVVFGSGAGGQTLMIDNYVSMKARGPRTVAPTFIANALVDSASGMIAIETGAIGHNLCVVSACATGTHSIGEGAEAIRRGDCIAVISGSTEAPLLEVGHACFSNMRGMGMPRPGEGPATVSRPFDATRDGFVLGEGAGSLFLEDLDLAKARGARIYAEVVGYGSAADGWDMIQPIAEGAGSARAMKMALERRGVLADEVDLINPHGTSTPLGDKREAEALWAVFGERAAGKARSLAISAVMMPVTSSGSAA